MLPNTRIFDSEHVGYLLRHVLATETVSDFQEWRPWRGLVVATAQQVLDYVGGTLVIPRSVLVREYWNEILLVAVLRSTGRVTRGVVAVGTGKRHAARGRGDPGRGMRVRLTDRRVGVGVGGVLPLPGGVVLDFGQAVTSQVIGVGAPVWRRAAQDRCARHTAQSSVAVQASVNRRR